MSKRIAWEHCVICGGGIRSLSLYSGKCQRCRDAEKRIKKLKSGKIININDRVLINQFTRRLKL